MKELCAIGIFQENLNFGDQNYHQFQLEQPGKVLSHVDRNWDVWKLTKVRPGIKIVTMAESQQTGKRIICSSFSFTIYNTFCVNMQQKKPHRHDVIFSNTPLPDFLPAE